MAPAKTHNHRIKKHYEQILERKVQAKDEDDFASKPKPTASNGLAVRSTGCREGER
jgi:hypothetical protein